MTLPDPPLPTATRTSTSTAASSTSRPTEQDAEVFVNGKKRQQHKLQHEDRILIGSVELDSRSTTSRSPTTAADDKSADLDVVQASSTSSAHS